MPRWPLGAGAEHLNRSGNFTAANQIANQRFSGVPVANGIDDNVARALPTSIPCSFSIQEQGNAAATAAADERRFHS
jgi:hypothetical protein